VSILEGIARFEELLRKKLRVDYVDQHRVGDHICYTSDLRNFRRDYPDWDLTRSLDDILSELAATPTGATVRGA
jgi:CDP-paratose 2-epimerase